MSRSGLAALAFVLVASACGGELTVEPPPIDAAVDAVPPPRVPVLVASPPPGTFGAPPSVTFTVDDPDGRVEGPLDLWYTVDGSTPVIGSSMRAAPGEPIVLERSRGLRVLATTEQGLVRFTFFGAYLVLDQTVAAFSSNLPVMVLWGEAPVPESRQPAYTPSSMTMFVPGGGGRMGWPGVADQTVPAGIKIRGSSTAGYPKHPWHVETRGLVGDDDEPVVLLGMPADSDWVLNAPLDFDRALMRNSLAFMLSNSVERWASHTAWAEVFIAGSGESVGMDDYVGVYEVTEMIKRGGHRVDVVALRDDDVEEPEVTGGYVFKEDRLGPGETGFRAGSGGGALQFQNNFVFVDPEEQDAAAEQKAYLKAYLDQVGVALTSPTFTTPEGTHYSELIDVDQFIDHHIVNLFTKNPDAFRLSGYYHKQRSGLLAAGPVWDFDRTMGCASDSRAQDPEGWGDTGGVGFFDYGFYRGLFNDPAFRERYWDRLGQLLKGPLSPQATHRWIDEHAPQLEEAAARNFARWTSWPPRGGYQGELQILRDWLAERAAFLNECLQREDPRTCPR